MGEFAATFDRDVHCLVAFLVGSYDEDHLPSGNLTELLKMTIEIVDFPTKNGDLSQLC